MGSEQLKKAGAAGRGDFARFKPEDLLTVADLGHTLHTPLRSMRYRLEDPQMIELINDIEKQGVLQLITVRLRQANGEWLKETAFGNRRVIACREVNKRRAERNEPPITIGVLMEQRMSDAELRDKYISVAVCQAFANASATTSSASPRGKACATMPTIRSHS
jgi:hypothetical protein